VPLSHERVDGEAFFITNGTPIYFWDFGRTIWRAGGKEKGTEDVWVVSRSLGYVLAFASELFFGIIGRPPVFTRLRVTMTTMTRYFNINKARQVLRYEPLWTLEESIGKSVAWTLEQAKKGSKVL